MTLCLTKEEIIELTHEKVRRLQIAFLVNNGIRHYIDRRGRPVVTRAAVEGSAELQHDAPKWKPRKAA